MHSKQSAKELLTVIRTSRSPFNSTARAETATIATKRSTSLVRHGLAVGVLLFTSCTRAPSFNFVGSFSPAWLVCLIVAVLLTAITGWVTATSACSKHAPQGTERLVCDFRFRDRRGDRDSQSGFGGPKEETESAGSPSPLQPTEDELARIFDHLFEGAKPFFLAFANTRCPRCRLGELSNANVADADLATGFLRVRRT